MYVINRQNIILKYGMRGYFRYSGTFQGMVGWGYIDILSCPKSCAYKEQRDNIIQGIWEENIYTFLFMDLGMFGKGWCASNQEM